MNSLYEDSLTGMPNLFGLMECDLDETFGSSGVCLFLDSKNLYGINEQHGRDMGDQYLRTLGVILDELAYAPHPSVVGFRAGGDLFILRFLSGEEDLAARIGQETDAELNRRMRAYGIPFGGVHHAIWSYSDPIKSVADLMRQSSLMLMNTVAPCETGTELPAWADGIIRELFARVRDTLTLLQANYQLAYTDDVSGLPNHRAAKQALSQLDTAFTESHTPFSVLFIDGDNLKRYNTLGYEHGNRMIRGIADHLREALRNADKVYRWLSGDEFLVLLDNTPPEKALEVAERLRTHIQDSTLDWVFPVTISIGVACCPTDAATAAVCVDMAEKRNALAKRLGKNRTIHAGEP